MVVIEINYDPNIKQDTFHASDSDELVYGGAKGGGKSCALVMDALAYGLEHPKAKIYLFRETYDDLEANLISEMKEKWPEELYRYNESKHIATLYNGTRVYFRYIRNKQDAEGYQGRSMDYVGVDELTKFDESWIQTLLSCLRSPKGFPTRFRGTCNPGGRGHAWVKTKYIEGTKYGKKRIKDDITDNVIQFIPAQVYDNVVLMKNDPAYVKRLENLPENEKKAFLYGDWDIFAGQYFSDWRRNKHVCKPFKVPDHWRKWRSIDFGYNDHTAVLWYAADEDGRVYVYRELYIRETLATDVAKKVYELSRDGDEYEDIRYTVAGHDMWQKRGNDFVAGENIAESFHNAGVFVEKADISRVVGWSRVREYLADASDGKPHLQVFESCGNLIRTLPLMIYDERRTEDVADHGEDHLPDSLRYGLMSRPIKSKPLAAEESVIQKHKNRIIKKQQDQRRRVR